MLVPIACRYIPYDQWFVTHLDDKWKVKQVKHWILSKCNLLQATGPRIQRPVSPITFAPSVCSRSSLDSLDDGYNEDDEPSDQDLPPRNSPNKPGIYPHSDVKSSSQSLQSRSSPLVDRYTLVSFSTGSMLEDDFTLSWYNLRPYELLEMHPIGAIAPLQRDILAEYIQPYFQAKVRVLRVVWNHRSGRFEAPSIQVQHDHDTTKEKLAYTLDSLSPKASSFHSEKKRKTKVNWKARWVVIHQGMLSLCKEYVTSPPLYQFTLSAMTALRGTDVLERAFSVGSHPRVVCVKFRPRPALLTSVVSPPSSLPSSPKSEGQGNNVHEPLAHMDSTSDLKQRAEQEDSRARANDANESYKGEEEWVMLDMLDDHAFSNILRILHREASHLISSSFAPSSSIIAVSPQSPAATSFSSYETIPYPEWRIHTVKNARKSGMGDVGKPMAWVLWTEKGLGETLMGNIRHHRQAFLQEMQYKTATIPFDIYGSDDETDDESEMEWEGWMRDLERQSQAKVLKSAATRQVSDVSSQLPSPPLSAVSSTGSPRVRSPSLLYMPQAATSSQTQNPHVGAHGYYCTEFPYSLERMRCTTVSTVSVGTAPTFRRRSSTVSTEATTRQDKGKEKERFSSTSTRTSARTVSASAGILPCPPRTGVRHFHSSSNLRVSSSRYESDATESVLHSSPSKRQSAFMRGVSLRAGKIVKGLESAIDFVDEKTT